MALEVRVAYADEGVIVTDHNWNILHVNEAAAGLLGISAQKLIGSNVRDTYMLSALDLGSEGIRDLQAGKEVRLRRKLHQPKNGKPVLVDVFWRPLDDGRLRGMLRPVVK